MTATTSREAESCTTRPATRSISNDYFSHYATVNGITLVGPSEGGRRA